MIGISHWMDGVQTEIDVGTEVYSISAGQFGSHLDEKLDLRLLTHPVPALINILITQHSTHTNKTISPHEEKIGWVQFFCSKSYFRSKTSILHGFSHSSSKQSWYFCGHSYSMSESLVATWKYYKRLHHHPLIFLCFSLFLLPQPIMQQSFATKYLNNMIYHQCII